MRRPCRSSPASTGGWPRSTSSWATRYGAARSSPRSRIRKSRSRCGRQEAAYKVSEATIRQRDADLKLAKTNKDRSESLYKRQLLPQQTYDDTVARLEAAQAQNDLANAQFEQTKARLEELKITLGNTIIASPVDGFVSKRFSDPGAFVGPNSPVAAVVDIRTVRMVANLVERDVKRVHVGTRRRGRSRRLPRREVRRPRQPRGAGLRPGDAHR